MCEISSTLQESTIDEEKIKNRNKINKDHLGEVNYKLWCEFKWG